MTGIRTNNLILNGITKWHTVPVVAPAVGQVWTTRDNPGGAYGNSVVYSPEKDMFVSVSNINYGTNDLSNQRNTCYSTNGNTWTLGFTTNTTIGYSAVCWSPELGLFVAVGNRFSWAAQTANNIMTSTNGINWTIRTSPSTGGWTDVIWVPELAKFWAVGPGTVGNNRLNTFAYSSDGINWTGVNRSDAGRDATHICYSAQQSKFVATTDSGGNTLTSPDGLTWTLHNNPINGFYAPSIAYSPALNLFVQIGGNNLGGTYRIASSPDGVNWTGRTAPYAYQYVDVCWSPERGIFSAVASTWGYPQMVLNSSDGINWTPYNVPENPHYFNCICWSAKLSKFVIMGQMTTTYARSNVMTSL